LFEALGTIAVFAGPGFGAVVVAALAAVVGVLDAGQVEVAFPIGALFLERRGAVADFHPSGGLVFAEAGFAHVAEVFAFGDGAAA